MTLVQIAALLIVLAAASGALNYLVLRLPSSIGILVMSLLASLVILAFDRLFPMVGIADQVRMIVTGIDFSEALLEGMLGLLLFAGALHVNWGALKAERRTVALMATLGVGISTVVVGIGFSWITGMPLLVALVFGALISPTDPVAVLGILRDADLPKSLEMKIAGESLFNDGVGYVVFLVLVGLAFGHGHGGEGGGALAGAAQLFLREAVGGAILGLLLGWFTFRVMRRIDDYSLEVLITLALAFGGYELAVALGVSAPIMAVCAGLLIGHTGQRGGMSELTRQYVDGFWRLIDEILNAVLFLLIGFEVFAVAFRGDWVLWGVLSIGLALTGRLASVAIPVFLLRRVEEYTPGVIRIMTWGGLKGGISVALALSLPDGDWKGEILTATYMVVVFSIIVQGLTVKRLATSVARQPALIR